MAAASSCEGLRRPLGRRCGAAAMCETGDGETSWRCPREFGGRAARIGGRGGSGSDGGSGTRLASCSASASASSPHRHAGGEEKLALDAAKDAVEHAVANGLDAGGPAGGHDEGEAATGFDGVDLVELVDEKGATERA